MTRGLILYGPPAAGKDTITDQLTAEHPEYQRFEPLKSGQGRTNGYRMTNRRGIDDARLRGDLVWSQHRYGAVYAIDRSALAYLLRAGAVPIVHAGQLDAVDAVRTAFPDTRWTTAYLWCPRGLAANRLRERGAGDTAERLTIWDETDSLSNADLLLDTSRISPREAARLLLAAVRATADVG